MLAVPGTYVGLMEAVVCDQGRKECGIVYEIAHDRPALQDSTKCSSFKAQAGYSMVWRGLWTSDKQPVDPVRTGYRKHRSIMCDLIFFLQDKKNSATRGKQIGEYQMCFVQGIPAIEREGEGDRDNQSMDWEKGEVQICGFGPSCGISLTVLLFSEPKSRFHITPQIYIIRGREAVINNFRRCGPVEDRLSPEPKLNLVVRYPGR